jgi:hypothetical protein
MATMYELNFKITLQDPGNVRGRDYSMEMLSYIFNTLKVDFEEEAAQIKLINVKVEELK